MQASIYGYVEIDYPLLDRDEADVYFAAMRDVEERQQPLRDEVDAIETPYREELRGKMIRERFPENVQAAAFKPEAERTPGEQLLAVQVLTINPPRAQVAAALTPEDKARVDELNAEIAALEDERPPTPAMAHIVTDGDYRFAPDGPGDQVIGCPECRTPPEVDGTYLYEGRGARLPSAAQLLPDPRRPVQPRLADVARLPDRRHLRRSADGDCAPRRPHVRPAPGAGRVDRVARQPADGAGHGQPDLAPPLRAGDRPDPRQPGPDGRHADAPRAARLAGRRVHGPRLEHQGDAPAADDVRGVPHGLLVPARGERGCRPGEQSALALPRAAARGRDPARCHHDGQRRHRPDRGRTGGLPAHPVRHPVPVRRQGLLVRQPAGGTADHGAVHRLLVRGA